MIIMGMEKIMTEFSNLGELFQEGFGCQCICTHNNLTRVLITVNCIHNLGSYIHSVYLGCLTYTHLIHLQPQCPCIAPSRNNNA